MCRWFSGVRHRFEIGGLLWLLLGAVWGVISAVIWFSLGQAPGLIWRAVRWPDAPWTLWTASLVHGSLAHGLGNVLALTALALLGWAARLPAWASLAWVLAWPGVCVGLVWAPSVRAYAGLSGLLHAGVGVFIVFACRVASTRRMGLLLAMGLAAKLLLEHAWDQPLGPATSWGVAVAHAAHLSGALSGLWAGLLISGLANFLYQRRG